MGIHTKAVTWVVRRATGDVVAAGPFAGMRYVRGAVGSVLPPKLLGLYERELHTAIARIVAAAPDEVVDAGAAEGYYAVGLARALPRCRVTAFEIGQYAVAGHFTLHRAVHEKTFDGAGGQRQASFASGCSDLRLFAAGSSHLIEEFSRSNLTVLFADNLLLRVDCCGLRLGRLNLGHGASGCRSHGNSCRY